MIELNSIKHKHTVHLNLKIKYTCNRNTTTRFAFYGHTYIRVHERLMTYKEHLCMYEICAL